MRECYLSAQQTLDANLTTAADAITAYEQSLANGGEWIGERDEEEGSVIWDHEDILRMNAEEADAALQDLRKAFAISAYHAWERSARGWTEAGQGVNYDKLADRVRAIDLPIHDRLGTLRDLVNLLKHASDARGTDLRASWPELLGTRGQPGRRRIDWYDAVRLGQEHMLEIFGIVAASGPTEVYPKR